MRNRIIVFVFLFAGFISRFAFAQKETGAVEGTVQDSDGRAIPAVTVIASSPSLIGGKTLSITNQNGFFQFPVLQPGVYDIQAQMSGFQTVTRKDIRISIGKTLTVDFTLDIATVTEHVEVVGKPPLIEVTSSAVSHTVTSETIHNLPKTNTIENLLALTPGVGDDLIAYGADGPKAITIWVDGVTMSDHSPHIGGDPHPGSVLIAEYNSNWIEEVQVAGIGAPAEYGGFTGVAGSFVTRSGGNQFHGLFETFFQNENLISKNTPDFLPGTNITFNKKPPFETYDISAQLGGPLIRNKFWFFTGFEYPHKETSPFGFDGVSTNAQTKFITKLTYKLNDNNRVQGFLHLHHASIENGGAAWNVPLEATTDSENPQQSWNATWFSQLSDHTTFEGRFGGYHDHYFDKEDNPDLAGHFDIPTQTLSVNAPGRFDSKRRRLQTNAALSHYTDNFLQGSHDFRFGVQFERTHAIDTYMYNGGHWYLDYAGMPYLRYNTLNQGFEGSNHSAGAFAQDDWNITDSITLNFGVRWDHNRGITDRGVVFANNPIAPRIGMAWSLDKDKQTVIKTHYGDYYEALLERNYYFLADKTETASNDVFDGREWVEVERHHNQWFSDPNLKEPFVRQFVVGVDHVLPAEIPIGLHYIHRSFLNTLEDVGEGTWLPHPFVSPVNGETITVFGRLEPQEKLILTNPPGLYRKYDAVEFFANKQFSDKLSISVSFVYSKLKGNSPGDNGWKGANTPFLNTPNSLIYFPGRLSTDPSFGWKIVGTYRLPLGFNTGWYFRHFTGAPWNAHILITGLENVRFIVINGEPAGSRRLDSQNLLDLRVEKEFPISNGQLRLTADILNVFNNAYPALNSLFFASNFGKPVRYNDPRNIRLGIRYTF